MGLIGQVLKQRYEIVRALGEGATSRVFAAHDRRLDRPVVIKLLRAEHAANTTVLQGFAREAVHCARLTSPLVVRTYDLDEHDGLPFLVSEHVDGEALHSLLLGGRPLATTRALRLASLILQALEHAHEQGILHRDLKPHNVLCNAQGQLWLTDFGLATALGSETLTPQTALLGSPHYFSPEQAQGQPLTAASDLYSVGIVLFEMLTGRLPFDGDSPVAVALKHVRDTPPSLASAGCAVVPELEALVQRALAKEPATRFASAQAMREAVETVLRSLEPGYRSLTETAAALQAQGAATGPGIPPRPSSPTTPSAPPTSPSTPSSSPTAYSPTKDSPPARLASPTTSSPSPGPLHTPAQHAAPRTYEDEGLRGAEPDHAHTSARFPPPPQGGRQPSASQGSSVRTRLLSVAVVAVVAVLAVLVMHLYAVMTQLTVPELRGSSEEVARQTLEKAGLRLVVSEVRYNEAIAPGTIITQTPAAPSRIDPGQAVSVVLSKGQQTVQVPSLEHLNRQAVRKLLEKSGLQIRFAEAYDRKVALGQVISQEPEAGTSVPPQAVVTVHVSKGPPRVKVPSLVGLDQKAAAEVTEKAGFRFTVSEIRSDRYQPRGTVISQATQADSLLPLGNVLSVVVSSGQETCTTPRLVGLDQEQAQAAATRAHLQLAVDGSDSPPGARVQEQDPAPGTELPSKTRIHVRLEPQPTPEESHDVKVPSTLTMTLEAAQAALEERGLRCGSVTRAKSDVAAPGCVLRQTPAEGVSIKRGSPVDLVIASPKE